MADCDLGMVRAVFPAGMVVTRKMSLVTGVTATVAFPVLIRYVSPSRLTGASEFMVSAIDEAARIPPAAAIDTILPFMGWIGF